MVEAIKKHTGIPVVGTDIDEGANFFDTPLPDSVNAIITSPPMATKVAFWDRARELLPDGFVAMFMPAKLDISSIRKIRVWGVPEGWPPRDYAWFVWNAY